MTNQRHNEARYTNGRTGLVLALLALFLPSACSVRSGSARRDLERGKQYLAEEDAAHALVLFRRALLIDPRDPEAHYRAGLAHLALGDHGAAFTQLSAAIQLKPDFREARQKLAELYATTQQPQFVSQANRIANSLLLDSPRDASIVNLLALTELELGERQRAIEHLQQAIHGAPAYVRSYLNLAALELAASRAPAAIAVLEKARAASPDSAAVALALGRTYRASHDLWKAERELRRAAGIQPNSGEALESLAAVLVEMGREPEATGIYKRLAHSHDRSRRFAYGEFLMDRARFPEAAAEFQRIFEGNSNDRSARTFLIEALRTSGRLDAVRALVSAILARNPKDLEALLERGRIRLGDGQLDRASEDLRLVLGMRIDSVEAHCLLARVYAAKGMAESYREELGEAVRLDPALLGARLQLADSFLAANNPDAALELLRAAPAWQQDSLPIEIYRNSALLARGDVDVVASMLPNEITRHPHPGLVLQRAIVMLRKKKFSAVRDSAAEMLKLGGSTGSALEVVAAAYEQEGRPEAALKAIQIASAKDPGNASLQFLYGRWLAKMGRLEDARRAFTASAKDPSCFENATVALARIELGVNRTSEARRLAAEVLARNANHTAAILIAADADAASGDMRMAAALYRRVIEREPDNIEALNNLAYMLAGEGGRSDEALVYARRAAQLQPSNPSINDTMGWLLYRKGFHNSAVRYLESAVAAGGNARRKYHLAIAYAGIGDRVKGIRTFNEAFNQNPALEEANFARAILFPTPLQGGPGR